MINTFFKLQKIKKLLTSIEFEVENPRFSICKKILLLREFLLSAKVTQALLFGGFVRDYLYYRSWYVLRNLYTKDSGDFDISIDEKDFYKLKAYCKSVNTDKNYGFVIKYEDDSKISLYFYDLEMKVDFCTFHPSETHFSCCTMSYDIIKLKFPISIIKNKWNIDAIYNFCIGKKIVANFNKTKPQEIFTFDYYSDLLSFSEKYNLKIEKETLEDFKYLDHFLSEKKNYAYLPKEVNRLLSNKRKRNFVVNNFQKIKDFYSLIGCYNIVDYFSEIENTLNLSTLKKEKIKILEDSVLEYSLNTKYCINDYDAFNICKNEDLANSIYFYVSFRGVFSNNLEIGFHDGTDWRTKHFFILRSEEIKFNITNNIIKVFIDENEIFSHSLYVNSFLVNYDIKRNNDYGVLKCL